MGYHKPITAEMARRAVEQGCGDNSCLFVKPNGMATNGGCRCFDRRSAHQLLRDLALALAVSERPAVFRDPNKDIVKCHRCGHFWSVPFPMTGAEACPVCERPAAVGADEGGE